MNVFDRLIGGPGNKTLVECKIKWSNIGKDQRQENVEVVTEDAREGWRFHISTRLGR